MKATTATKIIMITTITAPTSNHVLSAGAAGSSFGCSTTTGSSGCSGSSVWFSGCSIGSSTTGAFVEIAKYENPGVFAS